MPSSSFWPRTGSRTITRMARQSTHSGSEPLRVSLVALPDAVISTLSGIYDVMNAFRLMPNLGERVPFHVEIVGESVGALELASGLPIRVQRAIDEVEACDLVIVPSLLLRGEGWKTGRYRRLVDWLRAMHDGGAVLCSACSGIFLLAETGRFDGRDATVHFGYARTFAATYPAVPIHPERVLVISGRHEELVCSGASTSWHDLVLYLIARYAGATAAQEAARSFALQWHQDGLTPYIIFEGKTDHGDSDIQGAQQWLSKHFSVANPVEQMVKRSKLAERPSKGASQLPPA